MAPLEMVADPKIALSETASEAGGGVLIIWLQHLHCRGEPGPERVRRIILISCFAAASSPQLDGSFCLLGGSFCPIKCGEEFVFNKRKERRDPYLRDCVIVHIYKEE